MLLSSLGVDFVQPIDKSFGQIANEVYEVIIQPEGLQTDGPGYIMPCFFRLIIVYQEFFAAQRIISAFFFSGRILSLADLVKLIALFGGNGAALQRGVFDGPELTRMPFFINCNRSGVQPDLDQRL